MGGSWQTDQFREVLSRVPWMLGNLRVQEGTFAGSVDVGKPTSLRRYFHGIGGSWETDQFREVLSRNASETDAAHDQLRSEVLARTGGRLGHVVGAVRFGAADRTGALGRADERGHEVREVGRLPRIGAPHADAEAGDGSHVAERVAAVVTDDDEALRRGPQVAGPLRGDTVGHFHR